MELATELTFFEYLFEVLGNEFRFKLEHVTTECTKDKRVVTIEQGDAVDGTDLVEHHLLAFSGETTIGRTIFQIVGLVPRTEVERSQRDDGCLIGFFAKRKTCLLIVSEHCDTG